MADWSKPALTDTYANFLTYLSDRITESAKMLRSDTVTVTNPVTGMVRWNASTSLWETYNGSSWVALAATYGIAISGNAATASAWATGRTVALTGDVTGTSAAWSGSGNLSFAATLAASGVTAGTYGTASTVPQVTIDAKGRATAAGSVSISIAWSQVSSGKPTTLAGYGITDGAPAASPTFTGTVTLPAGSTTVAPLKWQAGAKLTTPVAHACEWDGTYLYQTNGSAARKQIAYADGTGASGTWGINVSGSAASATNASQLGGVAAASYAQTANIIGKQTIWIPAGAITARITAGPVVGVVESATSKIMYSTLDFDQSTPEYAQFQIRMPKSWNESTVTAVFDWSSNVSGTTAVVWEIRGVAISHDDALDATFGGAVSVTSAQTAQGDLMKTSETGAMTIGGTPAAGDLVVFEVYRNASSGSDTLAGDARLHGVTLFYTTDAFNDA